MNKPIGSLKNNHLSLSEFSQLSHERERHVLGAICYVAASQARPLAGLVDAPLIRVAMPPIGETQCGLSGHADQLSVPTDSVCDVWFSASDLAQGQRGDIRYRHDGNTLFGAIELTESELAPDAASSPLQHATERAYRQIFELLEALDYPFIFRLWNYMADINGHSHELERYRQFNLGRQDAFIACRRDVVGNVPAACALGAAGGALTITFMAGKKSPLAIENPRQISAYDYPQDYGPRSPTFSRASLVRMDADEVLLISGTASIVGHCTMHPGDVQEQTRETLRNIETVIHSANLQSGSAQFSLGTLSYRVYVRHSADLAAIREVMRTWIGASFDAVFLQADVCRGDLLIEIEASASLPA
jgi:enamine deaminase RidA (YjgF/YER057c/UK114 family)